VDVGEITGIGKTLARQLIEDGWTVSRLATAAPDRLEKYPGVGPAKAKSIVAGARALINRGGEREARLAGGGFAYIPPPATAPTRESERIRRIREKQG
jgi:NAD(P)-dependent dehydrogenase (short-subunit alcohol dehydrogenase family)